MVEKIIDILCEIKGDNSLKGNLNASSSIISDVGLDSLQMITFILRLEDEFNVVLDFNGLDLANLKRIDSVCKIIEEAMSVGQA